VNKNFAFELSKIGKRIKKLRVNKKMTQNQLATFCDIDIRSIQRIEKGEQNVSIVLLYLICASLDILPHELLNPNNEL
jgi:transcriptional regulator with XRE-family HTH domain